MKLQRGKFTINNINELNDIIEERDGIKKVIDLEYMGKFEYEGNAIPISRMFIEYYKNDYHFYPTDIYSKNGEQMYIYINSTKINERLKDNPNFISNLAKFNIDRNLSLWEYIKYDRENCLCNFWWDIKSDYLIFFGEEKIDIINYFIESCYERDGRKEEIQRKLTKIGYKL